MKNLLKEFALYLLIATVLFNLTVNVIQNNIENTLLAITISLSEWGEEVNKVLDETADILETQRKLLSNHRINLDILNLITESQMEPDFEKLLTATVEITTIDGVGAGVCIKEDTDYYYILTAQHVVVPRLGNVISIRTRDKLIYAGEVIKEDTNVDLALVRMTKWEDTYISIVKLADREPKVKDRVFAVGHPLGTSWTITEGIVSNLNAYSYLMTTAIVTYGNSGGALFNTDGNIIGIYSKTPAYTEDIPESSMGLAIKLNLIKEFLEVK